MWPKNEKRIYAYTVCPPLGLTLIWDDWNPRRGAAWRPGVLRESSVAERAVSYCPAPCPEQFKNATLFPWPLSTFP
jgi:hypothetical protein